MKKVSNNKILLRPGDMLFTKVGLQGELQPHRREDGGRGRWTNWDDRQGDLTLMGGHSWRQIWLISGASHGGGSCRAAVNGPASTEPVGRHGIQKSGVGKEKFWKTEESNTVVKQCVETKWRKKTAILESSLIRFLYYTLITSGIIVMLPKKKLIFGEKRKTMKPMQFLLKQGGPLICGLCGK